MDRNLTIWGVIFLLGSIQGVVLSLFLFFQPGKSRRRSFSLGFLILILAYDLLETFFSTAGYFPIFIRFLALLFTFGMGPSLYVYVRSSLKPAENFPQKIWVYFSPIIIQISLRFIVFAFYLFDQTLGNSLYVYHTQVSVPVSVVIFWIYLVWSWREYQIVSVDDDLTQTEQAELFRWIKLFLIVVTSITILWTIMMFWSAFLPGNFQFHYFFPLQIILVCFIYWVGFTSFQRIKFIHVSAKKNSQAFFGSIPSNEVSETVKNLRDSMEVEELFRDPELNLVELARKKGMRPKVVSAVLNQKLRKGFNEFVNEYRVEAAMKKLLQTDHNLNVTEIAFISGFNSLATFQRAFKSRTSMSPKEFIAFHRVRSKSSHG